ncbi:MAG: [FeFe] hydrogenase H-cluster maturation GTPase HydF [Peptoniphilus rhinitidis]|uniref:[FeFe] hydrogenase H-cluster maturation GTPase HydF n=1 Tax=Peptoniphilus TaxID=162289 RepID=UPI002902834B|nr:MULTISPECIES: [FeFe] hydrogenase H-cluster maturation GTPase HydF [Peptoniphilus]MDU1954327.1 [FeFe] hydrogenase H-cluster maturation GTPase HydF [Peptoniphilus lacydonensis]MDU2110521.1 [FeFe] hydrogenase H-cluster maturation GTPase HydF [Peptoniphilus lacydonensis]MDU3751136.1 [FeFe] hydrogenase H-cluster maturation GTPase HydF [Peptoniphilus rhinitidis]MDU5274790.1 [FeFe] hydrogenase H-cluster maturation GTPase HydF [Peptoniphilus lacydonensis]MDU5594985.1 [FeFe] hydrogenase H-cluster ma
MELNKTNSGNRIHIGFFGRVNSGKSSLINAFADRDISIVSSKEGTTTDPVYKSMEIKSLGPCLLMDTPGIIDNTELAEKRLKRTEDVILKTDIAVIVISDTETKDEKNLIKSFKDTPIIVVINKIDILSCSEIKKIKDDFKNYSIVEVSALKKLGLDLFLEELLKFKPEREEKLFDGMVKEKDLVLLVIPQDIAAPKNRLILPQVQSIRELLDKNSIVTMVKLEELSDVLLLLNKNPDLIVADSSVFLEVYEKKPKDVKLTSFSILFAKLKGDIEEYVSGASAIKNLKEDSKILIAECCTHAPAEEDIGRIKIPNMIKKKFGENIKVDVSSGSVFPDNISDYDLIIQCGGCMLNSKNIKNRIKIAKEKSIPITNYGIAIAYFKGILDKIDF